MGSKARFWRFVLITQTKSFFLLVVLVLLALFLLGCGADLPVFDPTDTPAPTVTSTVTPTATLTPSSTPLPPVGVFLSPQEASPGFASEMQALLSEQITALGYRFQVRPTLSDSDFNRDDISLVVAIPPDLGISSLVALHPETRFLTVGILDLEPAQNLTTIGSDGKRLDHQGFLAGYIAAMITPDWRVGVISLSSTADTIAARQAFFTGVKYYCGLCRPSYAPFYEYPLYFELGADADTTAWRMAADYMIQRMVETVYVVPGAGDDAMLQYLAEKGVNIVAGEAPLADIQDNWVVSLEFNLIETFVDTWAAFISGPGVEAVTIPMQFTHINPDLFSQGKQRLAIQVLDDVLAGYIDLGVEPIPDQ